MPKPTRRTIILGATALGGLMTMPATADPFQETSEPQFGPAPPPLAGKELPSFRYPLGKMATKTFEGGTAKEANVEGFPVSDKLAGVYMTLEAGALRELHWHANAAEWAYMLEVMPASPPSIRKASPKS